MRERLDRKRRRSHGKVTNKEVAVYFEESQNLSTQTSSSTDSHLDACLSGKPGQITVIIIRHGHAAMRSPRVSVVIHRTRDRFCSMPSSTVHRDESRLVQQLQQGGEGRGRNDQESAAGQSSPTLPFKEEGTRQ